MTAEASLAVTQLLDRTPLAAQLLDREFRLLHETPALRELLSADAEEPRVRRAMASVARDVAQVKGQGTSRDGHRSRVIGQSVRTAVDEYHLYVSPMHQSLTSEPSILVAVQPGRRSSMPEDTLRVRFRLTRRELQVARLLAAGLSNQEIAEVLGRSVHTARRHTEHTMAKLGVTTRARVAIRLREV